MAHIACITAHNAYITYINLTQQTRRKYRHLTFVRALMRELTPGVDQDDAAPMKAHFHTSCQQGKKPMAKASTTRVWSEDKVDSKWVVMDRKW